LQPLSVLVSSVQALTRATPDVLAAHQQARLGEVVAHARRRSPFYARKYRDLPDLITDVRQLPPVTKAELMAHLDEVFADPEVSVDEIKAFLTDPEKIGTPYLGKYQVATTSGTTGSPGIFLKDHASQDVYTALNVVRIGQAWFTPEVVRAMARPEACTASVFCAQGHFQGITLHERARRANPGRSSRMHLIPIDLPHAEVLWRLNEIQPTLLAGYASVLGLLASEQLAGRLHIQPALVLSSAEYLPPDERIRIQEAFGVPPRNLYGSCEGGMMGFECSHQRMHINADWTILEPTDMAHGPKPAGELSERVLLTNLANRVMPILRYELGDRLRKIPEPCPCGLTLPTVALEGHRAELLRLKSPEGLEIPLLPMGLDEAIDRIPGVASFQAIQVGPATVKIRLEPTFANQAECTWARVLEGAHTYLASQSLPHVQLLRSSEAPVRDPISGKFRRVWAEL
jgi:phenylacetate-coenzyme A ligase PaaK-like adenylate-forming protein